MKKQAYYQAKNFIREINLKCYRFSYGTKHKAASHHRKNPHLISLDQDFYYTSALP